MLQLLSEWALTKHPGLIVVNINLANEGSSFQLDDVFREQLGGTLGQVMDGKRSSPSGVSTGSCKPLSVLHRLQHVPLALERLMMCFACCQVDAWDKRVYLHACRGQRSAGVPGWGPPRL